MGLDCVITVKGSTTGGSRHHGSVKNDRTKRVEDFICGSEVLYRAVFAHVKECGKCDPQEVLDAYLEDRKRPKLGGLTSDGLVKLARQYNKQFPGRISPKTLREFQWRIGRVEDLARFATGLEPEELTAGIHLMYKEWVKAATYHSRNDHIRVSLQKIHAEANPYYSLFEKLWLLFQGGLREIPRDELENLVTVASVLSN